jgi:two-component system, chemotaxis family, sensor histidine kinase and response regulator WspE
MSGGNLGNMSVYELFRLEVEGQVPLLTDALLALEIDAADANHLKMCMRCVHSLKGAARMVNLDAGVSLAHGMEECLVSVQQATLPLRHRHIDALLRGADLLKQIAYTPETDIGKWSDPDAPDVHAYLATLQEAIDTPDLADSALIVAEQQLLEPAIVDERSVGGLSTDDRMLRVSAKHLNRLLGLASESLVASRWLAPFNESLLHLKRAQADAMKSIERLDSLLSAVTTDAEAHAAVADAKERLAKSHGSLSERLAEIEGFSRRQNDLAQRLYNEALASRMRPFADGVGAFPRMVRDLGQSLGKKVRLVITGLDVQVDRDILERLEAPLTHLLRNAVDHGIEAPDERRAAGKPAEAIIRLQAGHSAGMLLIAISDDGRGIDIGPLRERIVARQLTNAETASRLTEAELLEFLFLPSFTMKDTVSELSGRGVGLDVVQHMIKQVRGSVRIDTRVAKGTQFRLQLPLTTSVMRALIAQVAGEPYAFPLAYINRVVMLSSDRIEQLEGHQHFLHAGKHIGLITAHQVLQTAPPRFSDEIAVIILSDAGRDYGVIVDGLLGEHELVVQPLDPRLGKVKDIAAGALMENGAPVLIIDVQDMVQSIDKLVAAGPLHKAQSGDAGTGRNKRKRILLVEDSLTVRELERKLLLNQGYEVDVAVDGMDGWNAARLGHFDLVITDIDMPRMDGIELVTLIKQHPQLRSVPVLIVSYKDREEDRRRGLDAGADYYLTKSSFHDDRLIDAVVDLIGGADA